MANAQIQNEHVRHFSKRPLFVAAKQDEQIATDTKKNHTRAQHNLDCVHFECALDLIGKSWWLTKPRVLFINQNISANAGLATLTNDCKNKIQHLQPFRDIAIFISNGAKQKHKQNMLICRQIFEISNYCFILWKEMSRCYAIDSQFRGEIIELIVFQTPYYLAFFGVGVLQERFKSQPWLILQLTWSVISNSCLQRTTNYMSSGAALSCSQSM